MKIFETDGIKLVQLNGPFVELFFDWKKLPSIDTDKFYYLVRIVSSHPTIPVEYARPNSDGPMHFRLVEGVPYKVELLKTPFLQYEVTSGLERLPHVDLISEHENFQRLIWGNIDLAPFRTESYQDYLEIVADGTILSRQHADALPVCEIIGRPEEIVVRMEEGTVLFTITTNFGKESVAQTLEVLLKEQVPKLYLSTCIQPILRWKVRAEIPERFQIRKYWTELFRKQHQLDQTASLVGEIVLQEDGKANQTVRMFGYGCEVNMTLVKKILKEELSQRRKTMPKHYKLQLQVTSAHREFYKTILLEKEYVHESSKSFVVGFDDTEIEQAEAKLFEMNHQVAWSTSFLELVLWFRVDQDYWQEFQRETAHCLRWEFAPSFVTQNCQAEYILRNMEDSSQKLSVQKSGVVKRDHWASKVALKPFSPQQILVIWDSDPKGVEEFIRQEWGVGLDQVGFYLKMHEEFFGRRIVRPDLESHLTDFFGEHQNCYLWVEPNHTYSAEIIVRHYEKELALTPVCRPIVTPRTEKEINRSATTYRWLSNKWHHPSQREVGHRNGHDSNNNAKVMIHLHMHSPNLFRLEPFRESFLRDVPWPVRTETGYEVHNPPGEWVYKSCLDSWLPLLRIFRSLAYEGVDYQISLDISPPVAYMISTPRFKDYMARYLARTRSHMQSTLATMKSRLESPAYIWAGERYLDELNDISHFYNFEIGRDIIGAFRELELKGHLEICTCTATHGMAPELESTPDSLNSQIVLAARLHHRIFGDRPRGIWLAENAYFPGLEDNLAKEGLHYFFAEREAILWGSVCPETEEYQPVIIPGSEVTAFGRSFLGRYQIWDAKAGYAGHPDFREFHHRHFGLPLKRITSKTSEWKEPYNPDHAQQTAQAFGQDFYKKLCHRAHELSFGHFKNTPLITCTFDAELFGHHWAEGPEFLKELIREVHRAGNTVGFTTPSHFLSAQPVLPDMVPNPSTWGHEATHVRWTAPEVSWTQLQLERADELQRHYLGLAVQGDLNDFQQRAVEQMGAELVRAASSDLTFVIMSGDFPEDMQREILKYLDYFYRLKALVDNDDKDEDFLGFRLAENNMFPEMKEYYQIRK